MAWIPLHESALSFTNTTLAAGVSYSNSVYSGTADLPFAYDHIVRITFTDIVGETPDGLVPIRITFSSYSGDEATQFIWCGTDGLENDTQANTGGTSAFTPSPLTIDAYPHHEDTPNGTLTFRPTITDMAATTFSFLVEVDLDPAPPAPACFWDHDTMVGVTEDCTP